MMTMKKEKKEEAAAAAAEEECCNEEPMISCKQIPKVPGAQKLLLF